ncbi:hypothetical protein [Streptomyces mirabilis]|uniref:hypothetical protein n=1 Tax=Streptomyces mirabilis TaxID=68239 RepID=UPI0036EAB98E
MATDPERIEVTYDPCAPKRMTARDGLVVRTLSVLAYVLLGLPVTAATAAYPPVSLIVLLSALWALSGAAAPVTTATRRRAVDGTLNPDPPNAREPLTQGSRAFVREVRQSTTT